MQYAGYFFDLDGTIYRGNTLIDGVKEFIDYLDRHAQPYLFITNNATYTVAQVQKKLRSFGMEVTKQQVITSSVATAKYISQQKQHARCYVIGEAGLIEALEAEQLEIATSHCDFVVVGLDRQITYEKLAKASLLIQAGATYLVTNGDKAIPTEKGLLPGNGALSSVITVSTGVEPIRIGKPNALMMEVALDRIGLPREKVLMIGDNYHTDIQAAFNAQIDSLLVLTGFTTATDLATIVKQPTYICENLHHWLEHYE